MKELSRQARDTLERGLAFDGPSAERRARVKARIIAALGGGAAVLATSSAAAEVASPLAAGAAAGAGKGLAFGSLLVWFGVGAVAGVAVSSVVVVTERARGTQTAETRAAAAAPARARVGAVSSARHGPTLPAAGPGESNAADSDEAASVAKARPAASPPPGLAPRASTASVASTSASAAPSVASPSPAPSAAATLSEEAGLLQRAERALAGNQPNAALSALAEHERRFPAGVLHEERQAARVLALCELGRTAEARALARAFVVKSPDSVLVPRLERSCAGPF